MSPNENVPEINPWLIAIAVMSSTFMEVLDTTVVNVSLPHIAGNLSASTDEATWTLTSYLVANAIILPMTGWLAGRFGRKRLLLLSVSGFTAASFLCGLAPSLPFLIIFRIIQGACGGGLQPLSQAILLEAFPPEKRGQAMAFWALGIVGVGEGWCFLIDGVSYVAVIVSLLLMKITQDSAPAARSGLWGDIKEGWNYAFGFVPIRSILLLLALISLFGMPYTVLMPIFAGSILHGGPHTLGFLMGASGVGALIGAASLATRKTVLGLGRVIAFSAALFGVGLIGFGLSRMLWLSMMLLVVVGGAMMEQMAASNTVLQTIVEEDKRGRVMSLYSMAFMGMAPFGSLLAGALANRIGAPKTVMLGGVLSIVGAAWFARALPAIRDLVRPIYRELGIIPEIATGVQTATALQDTTIE